MEYNFTKQHWVDNPNLLFSKDFFLNNLMDQLFLTSNLVPINPLSCSDDRLVTWDMTDQLYVNWSKLKMKRSKANNFQTEQYSDKIQDICSNNVTSSTTIAGVFSLVHLHLIRLDENHWHCRWKHLSYISRFHGYHPAKFTYVTGQSFNWTLKTWDSLDMKVMWK